MPSFPAETYLSILRNSADGHQVAGEFDHLYAQLQGYLEVDHNPDGTHKDIRADSVTIGTAATALGDPVDVPYAAGNFTGGAGTWTVGSADQMVYRYTRTGSHVRVNLALRATTVSGTTAFLYVALPFTTATYVEFAGRTLDNLTDKIMFGVVAVGSSTLALNLASAANWAASTNQTYVYADFDLFV
jgi:hypothetical protein